jgi:glutathione S-transferase
MAAQCTIPKLTYFNTGGRAVGLRIALFKAFGKDGWEDDRINFSDWGPLKPTTPLGSLPMLTLPDGPVVTQTDALTSWAGKRAGLYPTSEDEALIVDEVIATSFEALNKTPSSKDPAEKNKLREEYAAGFLSSALGFLEKKVEAANAAGTGPWVVGSDLTIGDL